ncbi:hypothetical protein AHAS_Ahas04G0056000 [Arachis hypogaea]
MDRMREATKQQWGDYQFVKSSKEVLEAHVSHNSFFNQVPQHGGTPPIGLEVEDGSGISSKAPDIPKNGHKENLHSIDRDANLPWCPIGNFNAILNDHEQSGESLLWYGRACPNFNACLSYYGLMDLGYSGCPYTWKRYSLVKRLDRGISNLDWQITFPGAVIQHLPSLKFDHSPLLLRLTSQGALNEGRRSFRFLAAWLDHPDFDNVVNRGCNLQDSWNTCMEDFKQELKLWNHNILAQEKLLWFQKSCCNWLEFGNRNNKFFPWLMARKRRYQIEALQDDNGCWVRDRTALERMAIRFYNQLYTDNVPDTPLS